MIRLCGGKAVCLKEQKGVNLDTFYWNFESSRLLETGCFLDLKCGMYYLSIKYYARVELIYVFLEVL